MSEEKTITTALGIDHVDLRDISREGPTLTKILIVGSYPLKAGVWITTRKIEIRPENTPGEVRVESRMKRGVTDEEHDSSWGISWPLVGFRFVDCINGLMEFVGYIKTPLDSHDTNALRVPDADDDPFEDAEMCKWCPKNGHEEHPIVRYSPDANADLYRKVAGKKVKVIVGYDPEKE